MKRTTFILLTVFILVVGLTIACESANEAVNETANEAVNEPANEAVNETVNEPADEAVNEPANETVNETVPEEKLTGFAVYDRSQNELKLSEYVAGNKVTMINFWATFCGPCIGEMPELARIEKEYKDKGFEIVGVTTDATDYEKGGLIQDILKDADDILEQTGVEYPICFASADLVGYAQITAVPTTFFVDENGNLLAGPMLGSKSGEEWERIITGLLDEAD